MWGGPNPQRLGGLGERRKLPQRGLGRSPRSQQNLSILWQNGGYFWFFLPRIFNDALNIKEVKIAYLPIPQPPQKPTKFEHLMAKWSVFLVLFTSHFQRCFEYKRS